MLVFEKARNTEQTSYLQSKLLQHVDILYVWRAVYQDKPKVKGRV